MKLLAAVLGCALGSCTQARAPQAQAAGGQSAVVVGIPVSPLPPVIAAGAGAAPPDAAAAGGARAPIVGAASAGMRAAGGGAEAPVVGEMMGGAGKAGALAAGGGGASGAAVRSSAGAGAGASAAFEPDRSMGCAGSQALAPTDRRYTLQSNERERSYLLHVPPGYTGTQPVPLVFDFHGYSSNPEQQAELSGFRELADREGFLVVYPEGVGASWHVNGCCGEAGELKLDEIAFVRAVFHELSQRACLDLRRVYASGLSQGGGMAHHVGCLAADIFAGVAPVSSDLRTEPCEPLRPVTEISFRGLADSLDAYEGGHVGPPGMEGYTAIGARATLERWKNIDACSGGTETMDALCETYASCAQGAAVSLCSAPDTDHIFYWNPTGFSVPEVAWRLFQRHPR